MSDQGENADCKQSSRARSVINRFVDPIIWNFPVKENTKFAYVGGNPEGEDRGRGQKPNRPARDMYGPTISDYFWLKMPPLSVAELLLAQKLKATERKRGITVNSLYAGPLRE